MILAGDIGGTNTRLAFFEGTPDHLDPVAIEVFPSREHEGLSEIARIFLDKHHQTVRAAVFGIAGAVVDDRVEATNLPWVVDARRLASELGMRQVGLIMLPAAALLAVAAPDRNSTTACRAPITSNPSATAGPGGSLAGNRTARSR